MVRDGHGDKAEVPLLDATLLPARVVHALIVKKFMSDERHHRKLTGSVLTFRSEVTRTITAVLIEELARSLAKVHCRWR